MLLKNIIAIADILNINKKNMFAYVEHTLASG
jgi:hypothetical protein